MLPQLLVLWDEIRRLIPILKMRAEVLTYSRARGLFAGIDLSGSAISQDKDETSILFGKMISFQDILTGRVAPPAGSEPFSRGGTAVFLPVQGTRRPTQTSASLVVKVHASCKGHAMRRGHFYLSEKQIQSGGMSFTAFALCTNEAAVRYV